MTMSMEAVAISGMQHECGAKSAYPILRKLGDAPPVSSLPVPPDVPALPIDRVPRPD
jgi:hypothetical protein